jgi:hypothetical protein
MRQRTLIDICFETMKLIVDLTEQKQCLLLLALQERAQNDAVIGKQKKEELDRPSALDRSWSTNVLANSPFSPLPAFRTVSLCVVDSCAVFLGVGSGTQ